VRYYPLDSVEKTLRYAIEHGVSDVFFMDPTFNVALIMRSCWP